MKKAVIVFSGGIDSVCAVSFLKSKQHNNPNSFLFKQHLL